LNIDIFTLFPQWFGWMTGSRPLANAESGGHLALSVLDMRETTPLRGGRVDETPYGGGPGMVIRVDVVAAALEARYGGPAERARDARRVIALSPRGRTFDDGMARELATEDEIAILCGRYEGFDERVHDHLVSDTVSIGPYVLSGGEIAAMAIVDAISRRLPGALGNDASLEQESFSPSLGGDTEHPHYTRPPEFRGWAVPEVLLSGHHGEVDRWRRARLGSGRSASLESSGDEGQGDGDADGHSDRRALGRDSDRDSDPGSDHDPESDAG
jgi:tRNA (guanine37-N1)-methyltransferase